VEKWDIRQSGNKSRHPVYVANGNNADIIYSIFNPRFAIQLKY